MLALHGPVASAERIVVAQIGQTLDARIATRSGHAHYVTGPEDLVRLHRLRALVDAVVVGAGTVAADDPRLTVRRVDGRNPVRVVLDPRGRLDPLRRVFTDGAAPTLWVRAGGPVALEGPVAESGEVVHLPLEADGRFAPERLLEHLAERGLRRVLVEGGGVTVSSFVAAGAVDRLHVTVAPFVLGSGVPGVVLPPVDRLDDVVRPPCRRFRMGADVLFELDLAAGRDAR